MKIVLIGVMALFLSSCGGESTSQEAVPSNAAQQNFLWDKQEWDHGNWE